MNKNVADAVMFAVVSGACAMFGVLQGVPEGVEMALCASLAFALAVSGVIVHVHSTVPSVSPSDARWDELVWDPRWDEDVIRRGRAMMLAGALGIVAVALSCVLLAWASVRWWERMS